MLELPRASGVSQEATTRRGTGRTTSLAPREDEVGPSAAKLPPSRAAPAVVAEEEEEEEDPAPKHPPRPRRARRRGGASARLLPAPISAPRFLSFLPPFSSSSSSEWESESERGWVPRWGGGGGVWG